MRVIRKGVPLFIQRNDQATIFRRGVEVVELLARGEGGCSPDCLLFITVVIAVAP